MFSVCLIGKSAYIFIHIYTNILVFLLQKLKKIFWCFYFLSFLWKLLQSRSVSLGGARASCLLEELSYIKPCFVSELFIYGTFCPPGIINTHRKGFYSSLAGAFDDLRCGSGAAVASGRAEMKMKSRQPETERSL